MNARLRPIAVAVGLTLAGASARADDTSEAVKLFDKGRALMQSTATLDEGCRTLEESLGLVRELSKELRTISHLLHPPLLDESGLPSALRWYVDGFAERSKIPVKLELSSELGRLSPEVETTVFRIVQESLTNVHRHSGSRTAAIKILRIADQLVVEVRDEGKGMPVQVYGSLSGPATPGVGIQGMRERVRQIGGRLDIRSGSAGTTLCATLPVRQAGQQSVTASGGLAS